MAMRRRQITRIFERGMMMENINSGELVFEHYVPVKNVARRLCVTPQTIYKMLDGGELKGIQVRSAKRVLWNDVMRYERENQICHESNEKKQDSTLEEKKESQTGTSDGQKTSGQRSFRLAQKMSQKLGEHS